MPNREDENKIYVCLFEPSEDEELKSDHLFQERSIYDKDEIYIATSPSFSVDSDKSGIIDLIQEDGKESVAKETISFCDKSLPVEEYSILKTTDSYPIINSIDGQSFFVNSDYSALGLEMSKAYFYVVSPIGSSQLLQASDNHADIPLISSSATPTTESLDSSIITDVQSVNEENKSTKPNMTFNDSKGSFESSANVETSCASVQSPERSYESYSNQFPVSFIISDTKKNEIIWKQFSPAHIEELGKAEDSNLLIQYDESKSKPYIGQDIDSPNQEIVSDEQIIGVSIPQIVSCGWNNCGTHLITNTELIRHVNASHIFADDKQQYTCQWKGCSREGKSFDAKYKMVIHLRTHTGEKPHTCPAKGCGASFTRIENMKIHIRSHTGEKPYVCQFEGCDKSFANSSDRFKHKRTHMEKKPYRCPVLGCEKSYTDPSSLRKHKKRHGFDLSRHQTFAL
ncbi:zinc finger protein GLI4 [Hydra vulgaris]|uniref:Zinc finger protein GLI4 n=1 Tax=Hydra vulgaris TaxID=6087 RepID=A0ABM4D2W0_HYDVU